jgi:hypothetical protein
MNPFYEAIIKATRNYRSDLITLDEEKIKATARDWAGSDPVVPNWRNDCYPATDNDDFIQFLGIATAVNAYYRDINTKQKFGAWRNGKYRQGSDALCACLMRARERNIPLYDPEFLLNLKLPIMRNIFSGNPPLPFPEARLKLWHEVGRVLIKEYDGHFRNLFAAANYRSFDHGNGICERLVRDFPASFRDIRNLNGQILPFHKKALLLPLIYHGRAADSRVLPRLKDPGRLSPICDYQIPRTQRFLGHTVYAQPLSDWIAAKKGLPAYSIGEIDIRIFQVLGLKKLLLEINLARSTLGLDKIMMFHLDFPLWEAGRNIAKYNHHIMPGTDY